MFSCFLTPANLKYTNNYLIFHLSTQSGEYLFFLKLIYISLLAVGNNYKKSAIGCRLWIPYIYMYQVYESNLLFLFFENVNGKATCFPKVVKYSGILVRERDKFWHRTPKIRGFYSIKLIQHVVRITKKWRWINISMKIIVMFVWEIIAYC